MTTSGHRRRHALVTAVVAMALGASLTGCAQADDDEAEVPSIPPEYGMSLEIGLPAPPAYD